MANPPLLVRKGHPKDLDHLVGLLKVLFGVEEDFDFDPTRQKKGLALMLANPQACVLVAEDKGEVIGMCTGQITISTAEGGPALLVEDVVVAPKWQGRGVGRQLMEALGNWAQDQGISRLQLLADRENDPALAFYQALGWQKTQLICLRRYKVQEDGSATCKRRKK